jgi:hypothetical protein
MQPGTPRERLRQRRAARRAQIARLVQAIRDSDQESVNQAITLVSRTHRWMAPLTLALGAFAMLFDGVKLLFTNWRLTIIQVLPAMWIWVAMFDLKVHVLRGRSFHVLDGPVVIPVVLAIAAVTAASFFLNAVFGFAIAGPGPPRIRPAFAQARTHLAVVLGSGAVVGVLLGLAALVAVRRSLLAFAVSMSAVIAIMMVCYVAVPARLIGARAKPSRRDKLAATAVGGAIGAVVCTPPYLLGRLGLIMLDWHTLFVLGVILFAIGLILQAGATGAVKTIKMSARLISAQHPGARSPPRPASADDAARHAGPDW